MENKSFNKYQLNLYDGELSFSLRTDDKEEITVFMGSSAENVLRKLQGLNKAVAPEAPKQQARQTHTSCQFCSGECWDNRNNKKNPKGPDYKCKKCGGASWIQKDGSLNWKPGLPKKPANDAGIESKDLPF